MIMLGAPVLPVVVSSRPTSGGPAYKPGQRKPDTPPAIPARSTAGGRRAGVNPEPVNAYVKLMVGWVSALGRPNHWSIQ